MRSLLATVLLVTLLGAMAAEPASADPGPVVAPRSGHDAPPGVSSRIIGGYAPPSGMWPWMAAVQQSPAARPGLNDHQRQWCGGVLIHPRIVATAAHCIDDDPRRWRVLLGRHDLLAAGGEAIDVAAVWIHPGYSQAGRTIRNDLALLVLARPARATPAPLLPAGSALREGAHATVMGWGSTFVGSALSRYLRAANVPLRSTAGCLADYAGFEWRVAPDTTICAGFPQGGNNTCKGDSGGPLMMQDSAGRWYLVGINSWADSCALARRPTVFTFVGAPHLRDWLARAAAQVDAASAPATPAPAPQPTAPAAPQPAAPAASAPRLSAWLVSARLQRRFRGTLRYTASEEGRLTMRIVRRSAGGWKAATATAVVATPSGANQRMVKARLRRGTHKLLLQLTGGGGQRSQLYAIGFRVRR